MQNAGGKFRHIFQFQKKNTSKYGWDGRQTPAGCGEYSKISNKFYLNIFRCKYSDMASRRFVQMDVSYGRRFARRRFARRRFE